MESFAGRRGPLHFFESLNDSLRDLDTDPALPLLGDLEVKVDILVCETRLRRLKFC